MVKNKRHNLRTQSVFYQSPKPKDIQLNITEENQQIFTLRRCNREFLAFLLQKNNEIIHQLLKKKKTKLQNNFLLINVWIN